MSSTIIQFDVERIYRYLCEWDDFDKTPLEDEIARDLNLTRSQVKAALAQLEDAERLHPGTLMPYQEIDAHSPPALSDDEIPFGVWDREE